MVRAHTSRPVGRLALAVGLLAAFSGVQAEITARVDTLRFLTFAAGLLLAEQESQQQEGESQDSNQESGGEGEESEGDNQADQSDLSGSKQSESEEGDPTERPEDEGQQEDLEALQKELERAAAQANLDERLGAEQLTDEQLEELRRAQEQQQAMEQWLRRIPNDPGGLLRRKFRYQYQRMGKDQDGNDLWPDDEVQPW